MRIFNRLTLMKTHATLAAFILPVAIMFLTTGAFYSWGIKGSYTKATYELQLQKPMQGELAELVALATNELIKQDIEPPTGGAKVKRIGDSFELEWTGSNRDIILEPTTQPLKAKLEVKDTSWYRQFVQLHKAKGGTPFKIYAAAFATAFLLLLITGFLIAWQTPKLRKLALISASLGIVIFYLMVISS
ncbi:MAG: PepSY domain-containing protein [Desulfuromonadaceae bacterium]|nr:PepSY domain-containing protein [Desulfuromonadaceae bacterium]